MYNKQSFHTKQDSAKTYSGYLQTSNDYLTQLSKNPLFSSASSFSSTSTSLDSSASSLTSFSSENEPKFVVGAGCAVQRHPPIRQRNKPVFRARVPVDPLLESHFKKLLSRLPTPPGFNRVAFICRPIHIPEGLEDCSDLNEPKLASLIYLRNTSSNIILGHENEGTNAPKICVNLLN